MRKNTEGGGGEGDGKGRALKKSTKSIKRFF